MKFISNNILKLIFQAYNYLYYVYYHNRISYYHLFIYNNLIKYKKLLYNISYKHEL